MANNHDIAALDSLPPAERFSKRVILKVAEITNVEVNPNGEFLYIITLNDGGEEPRQIVSSIVDFYKKEELLGKHIVVVANLKPANFRGVRSNGMLLAASDPTVTDKETCEVLFAPQFAPGTILEPEGFFAPEEELCYVKPEKFFEMPLHTVNGFVEIEGHKICAETQNGTEYLSAEIYKNGNVG